MKIEIKQEAPDEVEKNVEEVAERRWESRLPTTWLNVRTYLHYMRGSV